MGTENTEGTNSFAKVASRDNGSPVLTIGDLPHGTINGEIARTGVVVVCENRIAAAVRHPHFIPTTNSMSGGVQRVGHIEGSLARAADLGDNRSRDLLEKLNSSDSIAHLNGTDNGTTFYVGVETEGVVHKPNGEIDNDHSSLELTRGQHETPHDPISDPLIYAVMKSEAVLEMPQLVETSAPLNGRAGEMELNNNHPEYGPYIDTVSTRILSWVPESTDEAAWELWNQIARQEGFTNAQEMLNRNGTLAPWFMNALHMAVGAEHVGDRNGRNTVRVEHLIGTADLCSSELGAVIGFMTASTPMAFGVIPSIDGSAIRDVRLEGRHLLPTAGVNTNPVLTPEEFWRRNTDGVVRGLTHTMDRASYVTKNARGKDFAVMHGQVRIRHVTPQVAGENRANGRVEHTGMGATPSLPDQTSAFAMMQIYKALAVEADANNMVAIDYAVNVLGLKSAGGRQVRELNSAFNRRTKSTQVNTVIEHATTLVGYMKQYPALRTQCEIAMAGINRLKQTPSSSLDDYLENPQGQFADVMANQIARNNDPTILVRKVIEFQQRQAGKILTLHKHGGNSLLAYLSGK